MTFRVMSGYHNIGVNLRERIFVLLYMKIFAASFCVKLDISQSGYLFDFTKYRNDFHFPLKDLIAEIYCLKSRLVPNLVK